ncbi:hypothetical protein BXZ70DRAFT_1007646 [Cristinia sonorae]|uniref:Uncharacterized protein n=1 Tax=Cristinia sonorae TaxID=1940300 RepID=A0A8K0UQP3_9AGAR|nr:hypothetical protein BXZ70DRAFT_1007646 [Cristinia sonorae]
MSEQSDTSAPAARGRGRGKSRGGLGKYLRARGRGRGRARGAAFGQRLVLEDEQEVELDEEQLAELQQKYSRRQLGSNADRYEEPEPELDSDGEPIVEPEVDLSSFLERQKLSDDALSPPPPEEDDDVDTSIQLPLHASGAKLANTKKGKVQQIEWDQSLEELTREKAAADATRGKHFTTANRTIAANKSSSIGRSTHKGKQYVQAPELPSDQPKRPKSEKEGMEDFLDDLLG